MENPCKALWYEQELKLCEEKLEMYKAQNKELSLKLVEAIKALKYYGWEDDDQGYYARQVLEDFGYKLQEDKR